MSSYFKIDRDSIKNHERIQFIDDIIPIDQHLDDIEKYINECFISEGYKAVQHGRVIVLRYTDKGRKSSAFKSAIYLGKYNNMDNTDRFLTKMVSAGHSYEPIRGESMLFLFIGVGKPVYDHLITYSVGRTTRIAGGQRANLPWGFEVPVETKDRKGAFERNLPKIREVARLTGKLKEEKPEVKEQLQAARSELPVGYIMPPFLLEFSEEALIKAVFTQRLFERGAQGATVDVVNDMWQCVLKIDEEKWMHLYDYHGPHIESWKKAMRTLRDKRISIGQLIDLAQEAELIEPDVEYNLNSLPLYELLMATVGKLPPSMWDKQK